METHELANKLLELPNETIFVKTKNDGLLNIKSTYLCECKSEVIIETEDY